MKTEAANRKKTPELSGKRLSRAVKVTEQRWPTDQRPLVSVLCFAYNQENLISECLDGILQQKTTFPIEIIVHDDASVDRTQQIILHYKSRHPHLFRTILQSENQLSKTGAIFPHAFQFVRGQYLARCDCDDYWSDASKLERQLTVLAQNNDCSGVFHPVRILDERNDRLSDWAPEHKQSRHTIDDLLEHGNFVSSNSSLTRVKYATAFAEFARSELRTGVGDYSFHLFNLINGPYAFIDRPMAVYRVHSKSSFSSLPTADQINKAIETVNVTAKKLGIQDKDAFKRGMTARCQQLRKIYHHQKMTKNYFFCTFKALKFAPRRDLFKIVLQDIEFLYSLARWRVGLRTRLKQIFGYHKS